jgi:hypothetical protein
MSNTPLVKTSGRAIRANRADRFSGLQIFASKAGMDGEDATRYRPFG